MRDDIGRGRPSFFCNVMRRIRVGILFGGKSKEREVSFAGGRTVFDVIDRRWFEPTPLFLDARNHLYLLRWPHLYSGSIRDFYPPPAQQPPDITLYDDFLPDEVTFPEVGTLISWDELPHRFDLIFLVLHGPYGEDGTIQGLLEMLEMPYTGSGLLPSALAVHKGMQKQWLAPHGFYFGPYVRIPLDAWEENPAEMCRQARSALPFPVVVKPATQGSSIGVRWVERPEDLTEELIDRALARWRIRGEVWASMDETARRRWLMRLADLQEGVGFPVWIEDRVYRTPDALRDYLDGLSAGKEVLISGRHQETEVIVEAAVKGREFTCIVMEDEQGRPVALPPSEIVKDFSVFDYRAKYLPGIVRKNTPMALPDHDLRRIMAESERLYRTVGFEAYARIDGFFLQQDKIYLNDPNTTSGMLPASFLFHQAAEVGLSPTDMVTWIILSSLRRQAYGRSHGRRVRRRYEDLRRQLRSTGRRQRDDVLRVAVVLGGCSTERHISIESGRNVVEKLSAHPRFAPVPVFLHCDENGQMVFHRIPLKLLMKDNADDIRDAVRAFHMPEISTEALQRLQGVRALLGKEAYAFHPEAVSLDDFPALFDFVFIAVHGHPGEDGCLQAELERLGMPYNGSNAAVSALLMNKYETNRLLRRKGFSVPRHYLVTQSEWAKAPEQVIQNVEKAVGPYPIVAKPVDEGCSSAVLVLRNADDLRWYAEGVFRTEAALPAALQRRFGLKENAAFPIKSAFLVEEKVGPGGAVRFLEITGGVLAAPDETGTVHYTALPPSETLATSDILSLEEKFLAGEGINITPARFSDDPPHNEAVEKAVRKQLEAVARAAGVEGYCRIDAFVRVFADRPPELIIIEINSLPGLTPATVLFQQGALAGMKPAELLETIIENGLRRHAND